MAILRPRSLLPWALVLVIALQEHAYALPMPMAIALDVIVDGTNGPTLTRRKKSETEKDIDAISKSAAAAYRKRRKKLTDGEIAGIAIGCTIAVIAIVGGIFMVLRKKKDKARAGEYDEGAYGGGYQYR